MVSSFTQSTTSSFSPAPAYGPSGFSAAAAIPSATVPPAPIRERPQPQPALHTSASKIQPGLAPLLKRPGRNASSNDHDSEVNAFQHHITLSSISASKMENAGVPDGLIAMEPSQASRTAEDFPVLCTDQKDAEKSGSVLHHATPAAQWSQAGRNVRV